jgi:hypothetical protein
MDIGVISVDGKHSYQSLVVRCISALSGGEEQKGRRSWQLGAKTWSLLQGLRGLALRLTRHLP